MALEGGGRTDAYICPAYSIGVRLSDSAILPAIGEESLGCLASMMVNPGLFKQRLILCAQKVRGTERWQP